MNAGMNKRPSNSNPLSRNVCNIRLNLSRPSDAAAILTSVWYVLGNPYGIDNMYIAALTPIVVMVLERAMGWQKPTAIAH